MEEVKIIYCYDENKKAIHYSKTIKCGKYYCIDCGAELICRNGKKNIKHLAHKNTDNCGGTGESIFHKHWKENLFKAGMYINISNDLNPPDNVEIIDVLNEIPLSKRYNKTWDIEIIVDVLLITEKGDIVVEINYKNPKDWDKLKPYYEQLDLVRVYEVGVDKNINSPLKWSYLGEEDETKYITEQRWIKAREKEDADYIKKQHKKIEQEIKRQEKVKIKQKEEKEERKLGLIKDYKIYFNNKTELKMIDDNTSILSCVYEISKSKYQNIYLRITRKNNSSVYNDFYSSYGIKGRYVTVKVTNSIDECYDVIKYNSMFDVDYDKSLYAKLCNAPEYMSKTI